LAGATSLVVLGAILIRGSGNCLNRSDQNVTSRLGV
jgi:hypothetical protein